MDNQERIMSNKEQRDDSNFDLSLRPKSLDEFVGQEKIKES